MPRIGGNMKNNNISETRFCIVTFKDSGKQKFYSYKTFFGDLNEDSVIYVETPHGIKGVTFRGYIDTDDTWLTEEEKQNYRSKATKWIIGRVDENEIKKNIEISNLKTKIKSCIKKIDYLKDDKSDYSKKIIEKHKEQLDKLLKQYSKLI